MGFKKFHVVCLIFVAAASYWVYSPLPPGYSTSTRIQYQVKSTKLKVADCVVGEKLSLLVRVVNPINCYKNEIACSLVIMSDETVQRNRKDAFN